MYDVPESLGAKSRFDDRLRFYVKGGWTSLPLSRNSAAANATTQSPAMPMTPVCQLSRPHNKPTRSTNMPQPNNKAEKAVRNLVI